MNKPIALILIALFCFSSLSAPKKKKGHSKKHKAAKHHSRKVAKPVAKDLPTAPEATAAKPTPAVHEEVAPVSRSGSRAWINLSLIPDIALEKRQVPIHGFTLSIWGENPQQSFALGFVNGFTGQSGGVALGLVNYAQDYSGGQLAAVNYAKGNFEGAQIGFGNYVGGTLNGVQFGGINFAEKIKGIQIGLVNYAAYAESGIQIGFVNILTETKSWFEDFPNAVAPVMVLANWRF